MNIWYFILFWVKKVYFELKINFFAFFWKKKSVFSLFLYKALYCMLWCPIKDYDLSDCLILNSFGGENMIFYTYFGSKTTFCSKNLPFLAIYAKHQHFCSFPTIKVLNCMILVSYWISCFLWLFDIKNNVVLGYFILIFGQNHFLLL